MRVDVFLAITAKPPRLAAGSEFTGSVRYSVFLWKWALHGVTGSDDISGNLRNLSLPLNECAISRLLSRNGNKTGNRLPCTLFFFSRKENKTKIVRLVLDALVRLQEVLKGLPSVEQLGNKLTEQVAKNQRAK